MPGKEAEVFSGATLRLAFSRDNGNHGEYGGMIGRIEFFYQLGRGLRFIARRAGAGNRIDLAGEICCNVGRAGGICQLCFFRER